MAEWELSKENIQPLKHGRKVATLNTVLQTRDEDIQKLLHEERDKFETEIRTYSGEDPLDPWYRYISWVEQSYPKGGKEGNIHVLIEKCIKLFKDDKSAGVDPRFLEVWLKYASMSVNPLDVYRFMYSNGMCTLQAGLYDAWAWYLETQNNYKAAEAVYCKGVDALTDREAKEGLAARKVQFATRVCRRIKGEEITAEEIEEQEQRSALGRLRAQGEQGSVGSVRVGSAKLGGPGVIQSAPAKQPLKPNNGKVFKIFQDENSTPGPGNQRSTDPGQHKLPGKEDYKENQMAAGKWTGSTGPKAANIPLNKISKHVKPAFSVHEDHESGRSTITPHKLVPGESNVLSARKLDKDDAMVHCPVALFEPPDPTKNPMYCKNKVYQGAREFSFEEMRAMKWKAKEKVRLENLEIERKRLEILEMERNLKERQEEMVRQMEEFKRMMELKSQAPPTLKVIKPSDSDLSSTPDSTLSVDGRSADNSYKKYSMDDTSGLINANPSGVRTRPFSAVTPSPHGHKLPSTHPSPTVNTKEALAVMQQLWSNSAVNDSVFSDSAPAVQEPKFEIFSDSSVPAPAAAGFEIYTDPTEQVPGGSVPTVPAAPFQIFSDDSDKENAPVNNARKSKSAKGLVFNFDDKENMIVTPENDENLPPPNYIQPKVARTKSGILTPAENVEWMPLEEQERLLDEDERKQEEALSLPKPNIGNATMFIPDECEFDKMAKMSSTPFTGRSFVPFEDENTCAVELVYRDPKVEDRQVMPPPPVFEPPPPSVPEPATAMFDPPPPVFEQPPTTPLSPIVETSREHYRSSSSSSGADTLHSTTRGDHSKSHWGNTVTGTHHGTADTTGLGYSLGSRTPGNGLVSACGSGYIGDKSSMSSVRRESKQPLGVRTEDIKVTAEEFGKRMEIAYSSQDDDQTGMFSDMLAEFKQTLEKPPAVPVQEHMERSLHPSFIETRDRSEIEQSLSHPNLSVFHGAEQRPGVHESIMGSPMLNSTATGSVPGLQGLDVTGGKEPSATGVGKGSFMCSAPGLNATGSLDTTAAVAPATFDMTKPTLNMTKPTLDITKPTLDMTKPTLDMTKPSLDMTKPMLDMTEPKLEMSAELSNLGISGANQNQLEELGVDPILGNGSDMLDINPFSPQTQEQLLAAVSVPVDRRHGYVPVNRKLPPISLRSKLQLGEDVFVLKALKGEGGFARVYSAVREDTGLDCTIAGIDAVLKVQKPANQWEWYICTELEQRIKGSQFSNLATSFMSIPRNYSFSDGGIFVSYHQELGTLLDLVNLLKGQSGKVMEVVALYYLIEMLGMVDALHNLQIIHADIKPDNFLLKDVPRVRQDATSPAEMFNVPGTSLQLIDFGRAIDLKILPQGISFKQVVKTDGIMCTEMREGRSWREHIDYYGIAASAYCILFGTYMEVKQTAGVWEVKGMFKRFWTANDLWKEFYRQFLNIQETLPSLREWRSRLMEKFYAEGMNKQIRDLQTIMFCNR